MPEFEPVQGLAKKNFRLLPHPPFNVSIRISQASAWFNGRLYLGGGVAPLAANNTKEETLTGQGAEVAYYDPVFSRWEIVYRSPLDDEGIARDRSVRALAVFQGSSDDKPSLYAALGSLRGQVVLLRSEDGNTFEQCGEPGLGLGQADIAALRYLCPMQGSLYTSPVGNNRTGRVANDNLARNPLVLASKQPGDDPWQPVSEPYFGVEDNEAINQLVVFRDTLYAATVNSREGFQLWKAEDLKRSEWRLILANGAFRGIANPLSASMQVFNGALYIGTGVQRQGRGGGDHYGPVAAELIRVWPDDSWDLVCGENRVTDDGLKTPVSGLGPGFDNPFVQAMWCMAEHEGVLYVGCSDWRYWPSYLPSGRRKRPDLSLEELTTLRDKTREWHGAYCMWCSRNGEHWELVLHDGLGNPDHYGIRELVSSPQGLFVVPAAAQDSSEGGAIEVWLGS